MLERRRDLSSIPVRESCSKARGEQKGGEWRRASEATGPDIGPVLSLSRPPPPPHSAFGRFSPFLFLVHCVAFSRWASNRNRDPSKASSVAPCTSRSSTFCLLVLIRSSLFLILPTVYSQRSCALFRFLPPRLLRVMCIIDENCPRKDAISQRIETERDCHGFLSRFSNDSFLLSSSTKREQSRLSRNF